MVDRKNILEIKNLSITYNSGKEEIKAVDNISLNVEEGNSLGLIGESGSGKTTFGLSIMGLINNSDAKVKGKIIYNGTNLLELSDNKLKKYRWQDIAIVFQNSLEVLNPVLTIKEQITEAIRAHKNLSKSEEREKIIEVMEMVDLDSGWLEYYPHQFSGGMRQRVLIAMALVCNPELLIIDEPTTSLDPDTREEIINLLNKLKKKYNFTMIVISHDMKTIKKMTSKLITMYEGNFVEVGITDEVIKHPKHCYTRGLLNSSPGLFPHKDLWGIKEGKESYKNEGCPFYSRCPQREKKCKIVKPKLKYVGVERKVACNQGGIITFLKANNISKTYNNNNNKKVKALEGVNIKIRSGELVALVGKSGSGKSTLAHILAGIKKRDGGEVKFMDNNISDSLPTKEIGGMQIVFQDPFSATSDRLTVLEVVREPLDILNWKEKEQRDKKAIDLIKKVQLPLKTEFINRSCRNLSGGQRQRIAIARALITAPKLLIADEITSMLDPSIQANIVRKLKGLQNEKGFSMLYITHNIALARKIADKVYVMKKGQIIKRGLASEIFNDSKKVVNKEKISFA